MPLAALNPFTSNPPRLPSPTKKSRFHNRSLSRSPVRQHPRDLDPLLRDLSPTSTLRAFVTPPTQASNSDALSASIQTSSASERALGAKAAQACLDLRTWTLEMESWQWPGTFDFPEHARTKLRILASSSGPHAANDGEEEYWGCLLAKTAQAYERRADEIGQRLDEMDVEELKEFVLNSHYRVDSRPSSRDEIMSISSTSSTSMKHLDDYTALVTATILQALPFLTRLARLLDIWTVRLLVLANAPRYLQDLQRAQNSLDNGWAAIDDPSDSQTVSRFDRKTMMEMKSSIEHQVGSLGRKLDRFLDDLEGRDDTVPDPWIDEFELLESTYGSWVVQAERKVHENEWWHHKQSYPEQDSRLKPAAAQVSTRQLQDHIEISEIEDPESDDDAVVRVSVDGDQDQVAQPTISTEEVAPQQIRTEEVTQPTIPTKDQIAQPTIPTKDQVAQPTIPIRNTPQLVVSIPSEVEADPQRSASESAKSSSRTDTPLSAQEDGPGQLAKRRAAFLHDIEINNSLKQSKSPVRPFEHASSAFTKLFKKNQSPEQIKPKRSMSNNVISPANAGDLSTGSRWTGASRQVFTHNARAPLKSSGGLSPDLDAINNRQAITRIDAQRVVSEPTHTSIQCDASSVPAPVNVSERPPLETYKPTGLDSPFSSPDKEDFPENWPLDQKRADQVEEDDLADEREQLQPAGDTQDESDSGPEIYKPSRPIQTDVFDQLFVQSMPVISAEEGEAVRALEESAPWEGHMQRQSSVLRGDATDLDMAPSRSRPTSASRNPTYAGIQNISNVVQEPSLEDTSSGASDVRPSSPPAQAFVKPSVGESNSSPPASPESPESLVGSTVGDVFIGEEIIITRPYPIKRASTTSIEMYLRSEVKSVDVQRPSRHSSVASRATPPHTPRLPTEPDPLSKTRSLNYKNTGTLPTPPMRRTSLSSQTTSPLGRATPLVMRGVNGSSPVAGEAPRSPANASNTAPLNIAMTKRRTKNPIQKENERPASPMGAEWPSAQQVTYPDVRDTFDRHVSEVLETLPAPIRFKPRPGAETPVPRGYIAPRVKNMRVPSKSATMTIAPAESSPKKSSSASDPEVKLYHLTQPGRDEPIRLFVRIVGEGERVMVRVGGGWSDLAVYLEQFAAHHGSRTVSDGGFEVQAFAAPLTRKVSGPVETRARTPGPGTPKTGTSLRPSSNDSDKDWFGRANTPNGERPFAGNGRQTPTSAHGGSSTPKSTSTGSSRPSTANVSRPSSRQGGITDVGLAGSSGKKGNLPEHKAKWVEGMLERAKKASAEKSKDDNQKYFSELGKAGGTRRVIFRSSPGFSTGERNK